jgi:uncharacterized repeat protein (TIGR02059 family)
VRDTQAGTTIRVSVSSSGSQVSAPSDLASISGDGSRIAFSSNATDLVSGDTNGVRDVFVRDTQAGTTIRASVNSAGAEGNLSSDDPAISDDGRSVAFDSSSTTFVSPGADTNNATDVFLRDIQAGTTTRISLSSSGGQSDAASYDPSLGEDGDYVAFVSDGAGLVPDDTNGAADIFVRSVQTGVTTRVNLGSGGAQASGNGYADYPSLSASGRYVVFYSTAPNLAGPNDANGVSGDVFLRDLGAAPTLASASVNGQTLTLGYSEPLAGTAPAASAYTVHAGSGTIAVSSVAINGSAATLTLAAAVAGGQSVTLDYALPAASPVADLYGHAAGAISAYAVANQLAGPAGTPTAGATTPTGSTVSGAKATPGVAGSITTGSGPTAATISWPAAGIATQPVTVSVSSAPGVVAGTGGFAAGTTAIQVTVTTASGAAVTAFSAPLDLQFPNAPAGVVPAFTHDGLTWDAIPALTGTTLPPGYRDGWYRDSAGTLHILTLHATYFGLLEKGSTVAAAFTLSSGTRLGLNLNYRHGLQLYLASSLPSNATITLSRAGKTLGIWHAATTSKARALAITIPRAARKVGTYRVAITARATGSTLEVTRNATLHFTARWRKLT